ncbi:MAG: hypothetical protein ACJAWV_002751 [Flammeovirgaceae bacterium]|jgi:hypothetical protein
MKYIYSTLFLVLLLSFSAFKAKSQCAYDLSKEDIENSISGYQYVKSLRIDGKRGRLQALEYTIVMKKDKQYKFAIRTPEGDANANGIVMKIYERRSKQRVFTNFSSGGLGTDLTFTAKKTGLYDIRFSFKGSKSYCGIVVCGQQM